jgi:C4-dicarboxylate-specific signal transduction histidine kinase
MDAFLAVSRAGEQMTDLLRALRAFVVAGAAAPGRVPLAQIVDAATLLTSTCARGDVAVRVARVPDAEVWGDRTLLVQVLVNLVRNAIEASPARGVVDVEVSTAGGVARLIVTDDGPGVAEDILPRLFEPFASSKDAAAGGGVGLALSAQIARELGGELSYRRAPERGAQFTVRLPLVR